MTIEEELRTAYANLQGHQERSAVYIRTIDDLLAENRRLRELILKLEKERRDNPGIY